MRHLTHSGIYAGSTFCGDARTEGSFHPFPGKHDALIQSAETCPKCRAIWNDVVGDSSAVHTAKNGLQFAPSVDGWNIRLTDPAEIELFGTEWIPLPLTGSTTLEAVTAHVNSLFVGCTKSNPTTQPKEPV